MMKPNTFKYSLLSAALLAAMGVTTLSANAATSGDVSATGDAVTIKNTATASYSVDGTAQPTVTSNEVVVNINEVGSFALYATQNTATDDINEQQAMQPDGTTTFTHKLENTGNVQDTYTINLSDSSAGLISGAADDFAFTDETTTSITVNIYKDNGTLVRTETITHGGTITLLPNEYATMSFTVDADNTVLDAGDSGLMTLTATSTYITTYDAPKATLTNEDQAIATNPIFKIVKSATDASIDLNSQTTIEYSIVVTNENLDYSANATNVTIADTIPTGLSLDTATIDVTATDTTYVTSASTANKLVVSGLDIPKGESVTIKFTVNITDKPALAAAGSVTNHATVYDAFDDTKDPLTNPDITDSTDEATDDSTNHVNDTTDDATSDNGGDTPAVVTFTDRSLTMTTDNTYELAPTDSQTVTHTITNNGNQAEGDTAGELVLTIAEGTADGNVQPTGDITVTIKDKNGNVIATKTYSDGTTSIDFNNVDTGGIPAGGTATISYTESSSNNYDTTAQNPTTTSDTTVFTLTPTGDAAPAAITNTDTFNVKEMDLVKTQSLDANCNGTSDIGSFVTTDITATPGQCVLYKITATSNFTTKDITNVKITDLASNWSSNATYVTGSASDSVSGTVTEPGTAVESSVMTLTPTAPTQSLTFAVKINLAQ